LKIVHKGAFNSTHFSSKSFDTDVEASHGVRLECGYVDYDEEKGCFSIGETLDGDRLLALANDIETKTKANLVPS
jgi:hypothetical protein